jgi:DNA-binding NarL/FixJ family response regulator
MTAPADTLADLRVLLVDDDADQRHLMVRLLLRRGIDQVTQAIDADSALAAASELQPHLVLLDLAMPGRSGFDALPDLVAAAPEATVVVVSNLPKRRLDAHLRERGAVGYVEKGGPPERLVDEILIAAALTQLTREQVRVARSQANSSSLGRSFVREHLGHADLTLLADVELLVSELISNAIVHASSTPRLEVRISPESVHVAVYDDDPGLPSPRDPSDERPGGRGLHIVARLATRWGASPDGAGKVVWFEIDRTPPSSPS